MTQPKRGRPRWKSSGAERTPKSGNMLIRVEPAEKAAFAEAAALSGLALSAWVRERLRKVAKKELEDAGRVVGFLP